MFGFDDRGHNLGNGLAECVCCNVQSPATSNLRLEASSNEDYRQLQHTPDPSQRDERAVQGTWAGCSGNTSCTPRRKLPTDGPCGEPDKGRQTTDGNDHFHRDCADLVSHAILADRFPANL